MTFRLHHNFGKGKDSKLFKLFNSCTLHFCEHSFICNPAGWKFFLLRRSKPVEHLQYVVIFFHVLLRLLNTFNNFYLINSLEAGSSPDSIINARFYMHTHIFMWCLKIFIFSPRSIPITRRDSPQYSISIHLNPFLV